MTRRFPWAWLVAATFAALVAVSAHADDPEVTSPVIHEDLEPPSQGDSTKRQPVFGPEPTIGQNPAAFADKGKILAEPERGAEKAPDEPVHGRGGFGADRSTEARPDYHTGADDTLRYVTVFNPSVLPFKRMSALDSAHADYTLYSGTRSLEDLHVGDRRRADRDLFWGSLVVSFRPGVDVPIPSVAPDMRILSYEIEPHIKDITFAKDGADNYFVRSDQSGVAGTFRLVFLADADSRYFAAQPPPGYKVRDIASLAPPELIHPLPERVQETAERALRVLGVDSNMKLSYALDRLVYYFRAFEAKTPPPSTGDVYWDLFSSRAGVCRHRSFAFMITANALGIPTRYVTNEAHAFVEVWVPQIEWIRIDLGGAALRMQVSNANDKSIYRPREEDAFSKPPSYANNYTRLEGDIDGLSSSQLDDARTPFAADDNPLDDPLDPDAPPDQPRVGPGRSLPELPASAMDDKRATDITVIDVDAAGYRGEDITVHGRLTSNGAGVAGQRIDIFLAPAGFAGDEAVLVGHTVSDDNGRFAADVVLSHRLQPRDYEVFAATPGDSKYGPAVSD